MDFRTKSDNQNFGVRASALMMKDGKIFLAKSPNDAYYLLGGAIHIGELAEDAVRREIMEEVGVEIKVDTLAFVVENLFKLNEISYHQIEFHYLVSPLSKPQETIIEGGEARICEWVALKDLDKINLNPSFLKKELKNWDGKLRHFKNIDSKENG
ncbi:NUDIX hydrolase [Streptococcus castoreus]|uniref:NUDIX hydrolase n=1 Tax=Streptococcus castoreus TaxID=254786 RepID=UPI0004137453|nr:NUDIX hydrolase [Streptococcus castoreus]